MSATAPTLDEQQTNERSRFIEFCVNHSDPQFRLGLIAFYQIWQQHFDNCFANLPDAQKMLMPHGTLGETPPNTFASTTQLTHWGAQLQMVLAVDLFLPPENRRPNSRIIRRFPSPGIVKLISDVVVHEMIHQYLLEVRNITEKGYDGHGPQFTALANRLTPMLGLSGTVVARRRGSRHRNASTSAFWPFCLRPAGYYESDVIVDFGASRNSQTTPATPARSKVATRYLNAEEAILRLAYRMLEQERYTELKRVIRTMLDYRLAFREPAWLAHEAKPHDHEGKPVLTPAIEWDWLTKNSNTARYLAESIVQDARFDLLPIFADAIQDVGCEDAVLLDHCRQSREHSGKCWLVKLLAETLAQHTAE